VAKKKSPKRKYVEMSVDDWFERFRPITNHVDESDPEGHEYFETFGPEYQEVLKANRKNPRTVWTRLDSDVILSGLHWANRLAYYITRRQAALNTDYVVYFEEIPAPSGPHPMDWTPD
jgi:hypothetical protein